MLVKHHLKKVLNILTLLNQQIDVVNQLKKRLAGALALQAKQVKFLDFKPLIKCFLQTEFLNYGNVRDWESCCILFSRLPTPSIIQPYSWLLKFYKENKEITNHAIIKMLYRVAVDLKTPSMLFQLSLFGTFQKILSDPAANQYKVSESHCRLQHAPHCSHLRLTSLIRGQFCLILYLLNFSTHAATISSFWTNYICRCILEICFHLRVVGFMCLLLCWWNVVIILWSIRLVKGIWDQGVVTGHQEDSYNVF